ncbi:MAG: serine protease [Alphaproteobacteria bacterium]|nr:serine protease [Alphaproteobacteria bacterium]
MAGFNGKNGFASLAVGATLALAPYQGLKAADFGPELFQAVVKLVAEVPKDARSAQTLGTRREGNGVVIDDNGLVLTIGYLIVEAMAVTLEDHAGKSTAAEIVGYDHDTGFGLVRANAPLGVKPLRIGDSRKLEARDPVLVIGHGGPDATVAGVVMSRRLFAGYWEYMLERAIFTSPPHGNWGGTALIGKDGTLLGIGSLFVNDAADRASQISGNMFVPIDLLKPIMGDLLSAGRPSGAPRPWLGMLSTDQFGVVLVTRVTPDAPAHKAGLRPGDVVVAVRDKPVKSVEAFYRALWASGEAGVEVPLTVMRQSGAIEVVVKSASRYDFMQFRRTF